MSCLVIRGYLLEATRSNKPGESWTRSSRLGEAPLRHNSSPTKRECGVRANRPSGWSARVDPGSIFARSCSKPIGPLVPRFFLYRHSPSNLPDLFSIVYGIRIPRARARARASARWLFQLRRCGSLIEAVGGNLQTYGLNCYTGLVLVRPRENVRTEPWTEVLDRWTLAW